MRRTEWQAMTEATLKRTRELADQERARKVLKGIVEVHGKRIGFHTDYPDLFLADIIDYFAAEFQGVRGEVAQEALEKVAAWMIEHSYSTGHGETLDDLLKELSWQMKERSQQARLEEAKWWRETTAVECNGCGMTEGKDYSEGLAGRRIASLEQRTGTTKGE